MKLHYDSKYRVFLESAQQFNFNMLNWNALLKKRISYKHSLRIVLILLVM